MAKSNPKRLKIKDKIYLDYAASVLPNPSSIHSLGEEAKKKMAKARAEVALLMSARPEEIIFTSGGTESNNLAIQGVINAFLESNANKKSLPHIVTTNIEHPSVLETCRMLQKRKLATLSIVPVSSSGIVDPKKIKQAINNQTVLVSVMYANNEIGTIQPIREIAKEIRHFRKNSAQKIFPIFHTDAVQAANYLDLNVERLGVDLLSITGSKIEGAPRIGVLYKRKSVSVVSIFGGGDQEYGLRPGTENLSDILKFTDAFINVRKIHDQESKRVAKLRDYFLQKISKSISPIQINGDLKNRLPNNINVTFDKIPSDLLVLELSAKNIMTSSKSACKSSSVEGSYVLKAINPEADLEIGGVRFSLGKDTTKAHIDYTIKALSHILLKLKKWYT